MLEWTGERYLPYGDPALYGAEIHYEHLHRYAFASQFVKGKKVLDLASGEGYGTFILSKDAQSVVGIEIDPVTVSHAANTYVKKNIEFKEGSILNIPIEGKKLFDVIVCFEAIEHVKEHDILLNEIRRLIKDDGLLIISTPDKKQYSEETGYQNPYHLKELYQSEFSELLQKYFSYVYLSGQQVFSGSSIYPVSSKKNISSSEFIIEYEDKHFSFTERNEKNPRYLIAIASNIKINPREIQKSYLIDKSNIEFSLSTSRQNQITELSKRNNHIEAIVSDRDNQIIELRQHIHNLEAIISDRETQIFESQKHTHNVEAIVSDRDNQIIELRQHIHNLGAIISDRETRITESQKHTHDLEAIISDRETQISESQKYTHDLEAIISDRETQISESQKYTHDLEEIISDRKIQIAELEKYTHDLEEIISDRETQVSELQKPTHNLEKMIFDRETQVSELRKHAHNLEEIITNQNQQLQEFIRFNQSLSNENQSIKQSIFYNLTTKFHKKIVERLLPQNTRRRKYYNLGLSGSRLLINEGWDRFWWCFQERKHRLRSYTDHVIPIPQPREEIQELDNHLVIQTRISVIIPTKNAGTDFPSVLEKIINQTGIASVEIIIVDSGSTDGTCKVAEKYGCRIFPIKPEEFNHGLTRNYGAEQANGEFIVFLVQDAIPIGDYWLYDMVKFFKIDEKIAAVTCRQIPRSDADLFAGFILWSHYRSLKRTQNRVYSCDNRFDELVPVDKRISAGIEDTCCMMQKKIFNKFRFRNIQYGEDLDIGIRLLKAGNKTAFVFSAGVIHSHNRDSTYFFKRSFVDAITLDSLLNVSQNTADNNSSLKDLMEQVLGLYSLIHQNLTKFENKPFSGIQIINHLKMFLQSPSIHPEYHLLFSETGHSTSSGSINKLEVLLTDCAGLVHANSSKQGNSLITSYCAVLDSFSEYCSVYSSLEGREQEFSESFDKLFALIAGSTLATYYCHKTSIQLSESESALMKRLGEGI